VTGSGYKAGVTATWWLARGEDQLPAAADWLSAAERSRVGALRYTKRRTDFLLGRWTLKLAVASAHNVSRTPWRSGSKPS